MEVTTAAAAVSRGSDADPQTSQAADGPPDVVFPVRPGERNEELRYALRSLSALPHGKVWVAGHKPSWVENVRHVPRAQTGTKYRNSTRNLLAACQESDVSEQFVLWNDDFFLLRPIKAVPALHRGTMREFVEERAGSVRGAYTEGVEATAKILARLGHDDPLCYEVHVPMPMDKAGVLEAYAAAVAGGVRVPSALQMRSLYGNLARLGGEQVGDEKVSHSDADDWSPAGRTFVSTSDKTFRWHPASKYVQELYCEPGPYERKD